MQRFSSWRVETEVEVTPTEVIDEHNKLTKWQRRHNRDGEVTDWFFNCGWILQPLLHPLWQRDLLCVSPAFTHQTQFRLKQRGERSWAETVETISLLLVYLRLLCRCRIVLRQIRRSFSKMSELENELTSSVTSFLVTSPELPVMTTTLVIVFLALLMPKLETLSFEIFARPPVFFFYMSFFLCFVFGLLVSFLPSWCPHGSLKLSSLQQTLILFQNAYFSGPNSHSATEYAELRCFCVTACGSFFDEETQLE